MYIFTTWLAVTYKYKICTQLMAAFYSTRLAATRDAIFADEIFSGDVEMIIT
jgi:hypothetical protein